MFGDPVGIPGCASVEGESLLPARSVLGDVIPHKAYTHRNAIKRLHLLIEETDAIGKRAYHGTQIWRVAIIQLHDRPELGRFVERAQALAYLAIGQRALKMVDVGPAIEVGCAGKDGGKFLPDALLITVECVSPSLILLVNAL